MIEIIWLSFLAAVFSLDVTAFGQSMISRPIVCAPILGYLLGDVQTGFWVGVITELLWITALPMGTSVPIDTTVVAILATIWGIGYLNVEKSSVILALSLALPAGILFKYFDIKLRYLNSKIASWVEAGVKDGKEYRISTGVYIGLGLFFVKAFLFYVILIYPGNLILSFVFDNLPARVHMGLGVAWYILPVVGFGIVFVNFGFGKNLFRK